MTELARRIKALRSEADTLEKKVKELREDADYIENECQHNWSEPIAKEHVTPGGYDPGDPPGTMGVDRRLPMHYSSTRTPYWERTCSLCGKIQKTQNVRVEMVEKKVPYFPSK